MATNNDRKLWEERAQKLKRKRMGQDTVKGDKAGAVGSHILAEREMTVQRLSSVATGKAMKFNKMGPQEFVAYPFDELTIENLIQACSAHFRDELLDNQRCDILQSQDGPSCSKLSHIKSYKVIYVRLITNVNQASISIRKYFDKMKMPPRSPLSSMNVLNSSAVSTPSKSIKLQIPQKQKPVQTTQYPKSLSISNMLQFGTAITKMQNPPMEIELQEIDVSAMKWSYPTSKRFSISETPLTKGGFREVSEAIDLDTKKKFVVKTFLPEVFKVMEEVNTVIPLNKESEESLSKKAIQAHALAKNVTDSLKKLCFNNNLMDDFGEFFTYNKAYLGSKVMHGGEKKIVMVEEYVDGEFIKFINNMAKSFMVSQKIWTVY
ncbi:uncharacterized protein [Clytia hemisphaerica]|uniref:uncharacterized protein n=1 Tax=Clytia hemisphaerica TaxID=252671 RepID=UPI0034D62B7A